MDRTVFHLFGSQHKNKWLAWMRDAEYERCKEDRNLSYESIAKQEQDWPDSKTPEQTPLSPLDQQQQQWGRKTPETERNPLSLREKSWIRKHHRQQPETKPIGGSAASVGGRELQNDSAGRRVGLTVANLRKKSEQSCKNFTSCS